MIKINYIGYIKGILKNFNIYIFSKFGNGNIFIYGKLDEKILKSLINIKKLFMRYYNIFNIKGIDIFIKIKPINMFISECSLDLSLFIGIFFTYSNLIIKGNIYFLGCIDKNGNVRSVGNFIEKINFCYNLADLIFISKDNCLDLFYFNNYKNINFIYIENINDFYIIYKKCLAQMVEQRFYMTKVEGSIPSTLK